MAENPQNPPTNKVDDVFKAKPDQLDSDALNSIIDNREYIQLATNLYKYRRPLNEHLTTGFNYVFFTCPRLSLTRTQFTKVEGDNQTNKNGVSNADLYYRNNCRHLGLADSTGDVKNDSIYDEHIISVLSAGNATGKFMTYLTNTCTKFSAIESKLDTLDYAETWNKHKIVLGTSMQDSRLAGNFTLEFMEDNELHIMKLHNLWTTYIEKVFLGDVVSMAALNALRGGDLNSGRGSFGSGVVDYLVSMYHFSVMPDGETLQYWAKYTGVMPVSNPWSIFTTDDGAVNAVNTVPIEYQYSFKEEMKIHILKDFNMVSSSDNKIFDKASEYFYNSEATVPVIETYPRIVAVPKTAEAEAIGRTNIFKLDFGLEL